MNLNSLIKLLLGLATALFFVSCKARKVNTQFTKATFESAMVSHEQEHQLTTDTGTITQLTKDTSTSIEYEQTIIYPSHGNPFIFANGKFEGTADSIKHKAARKKTTGSAKQSTEQHGRTADIIAQKTVKQETIKTESIKVKESESQLSPVHAAIWFLVVILLILLVRKYFKGTL